MYSLVGYHIPNYQYNIVLRGPHFYTLWVDRLYLSMSFHIPSAPLQGFSLLEGFSQYNLAAVSGFIPGMNPLMDTESGLPAEGLPTFRTFIWFLSCVDSQM